MFPLGKLRCHVPRLLASVIAPAAVTVTVLPTFTGIGVTNPKSATLGVKTASKRIYGEIECFIYSYADTIIALYSEGMKRMLTT